jgi:Pyruvate/2-oxoacid:ferredoxin oxidoreductase delta subunit
MKTSLLSMRSIVFAAIALFALSQCSEEDIVPAQTAATVEDATEAATEATGSFTITGVYTTYESVEDCTTCTFFVPANSTEIDGVKLNLKAGSVICLDKAFKYGDLNFTNLEGTEESPIIIGMTDRKK